MRAPMLLLAAAAALSAGCAQQRQAPTPPLASPLHRPALMAAAQVVDITPAPGLSLQGHGPAGRVATGTMLRLRCHPLVLAQGGEILALVPCDLGWPSFMVQRQIAARVQLELGHVPGSTTPPPIGAEDIVLFATHTHAAPGHQFASTNYSGLMSSPQPGYSDEVAAFVAEQIAHGIAQAYRELAPAKMGWGFTELHGVSKNRSLDALANNLFTAEERASLEGGQELSLARRAIDPRVAVLRVDDLSGEPIGGFAVFGVHGTSTPSTNELYHGDLFGFATRAFSRRCLERHSKGCRVGIANGLSADVGPAADYPGPREARRLGELLGEAVADTFERIRTEPCAQGEHPARGQAASCEPQTLAVAYGEVAMNGAFSAPDPDFFREVDRVAPWTPSRSRLDTSRLCEEPALGIVASGGLEDNYTLFHPLGDTFRESGPLSVDPDGAGCHAPKREVATIGQGRESFPSVAPMHTAVVGRTLLATFPAELTVIAGKRGQQRMQRWLDAVATERPELALPTELVPITLANEYLQYVTTEDEYARQSYEGASNLYGPATLRMLVNEQLCLTRRLLLGEPCLGHPARDTLSPVAWQTNLRALSPKTLPFPGEVRLGTPAYSTRDGEHGLRVELRQLDGGGELRRGIRVQIADAVSREVIDDDEGDGVAVRYVTEDVPGGCSRRAEARGGCPYWELTWFPRADVRARQAGRPVQFVVREAGAPRKKLCGAGEGCTSPAATAPVD